jgi:hypothetical protein
MIADRPSAISLLDAALSEFTLFADGEDRREFQR